MNELQTANSGKWGELLLEFKAIDRNDKKAYEALKDKTKNTNGLTQAQRSGIIDRCNNVLNGTYSFGDMGYKQNSYDKNRSENKK